MAADFGVILESVAALVPPVFALLNLDDHEPTSGLDEYDPDEVIDCPRPGHAPSVERA